MPVITNGTLIKMHDVPIVIEHVVILICLCHGVQNHCFYSEGLLVVHRYSCQGNGPGFEDAGSSC